MQYIIGIDGGGSKTVLIAADPAGRPLCRIEGGSTNINTVGTDSARHVLEELTAQAVQATGSPIADCAGLCIGAAGVDREDDKAIMADILWKVGYRCPVEVTNDGIIALWEGARGVGVVVASGTGSICYGRNPEGLVARAGGWGHIFSDEGSAYAIAVKALNEVSRSVDGRTGPTRLTPLILQFLGLQKPEDLIARIYRGCSGKRDIARIAKVVDIAADAGDPAALQILQEAGCELGACGAAVAGRLGFGASPFVTVLAGSVLLGSHYVSDSFRRHMKEKYPLTEFRAIPGRDTAMGAVFLAASRLAGK